MIICTKQVERKGFSFSGLCKHCRSEYTAQEGDIKSESGGRNDTYYTCTSCTVCNKTGTVAWEKVGKVTYEEMSTGSVSDYR